MSDQRCIRQCVCPGGWNKETKQIIPISDQNKDWYRMCKERKKRRRKRSAGTGGWLYSKYKQIQIKHSSCCWGLKKMFYYFIIVQLSFVLLLHMTFHCQYISYFREFERSRLWYVNMCSKSVQCDMDEQSMTPFRFQCVLWLNILCPNINVI